MKPITFLSLLLFTAICLKSTAQIPAPITNNISKKTTKRLDATSERRIGEADYDYNGIAFTPGDTIYYTYSNGRYINNNPSVYTDYCFDYCADMLYASGSSTYQNYTQERQTFDANNNLLTLVIQSWNTLTSSYVDSIQYVYTYDANNNVLTYLTQTWSNASVVTDGTGGFFKFCGRL